MASISSAQEKYTAAAIGLATGAWPLRERLIDNYLSQAYHAYPLDNDDPALSDLRDRIESLHRTMTQRGNVADTVTAMTDQNIHDAATEIFSIATQVTVNSHMVCPGDRAGGIVESRAHRP